MSVQIAYAVTVILKRSFGSNNNTMRNSSSPSGSSNHGAHASAMLSALDDVAVDVAASDMSGESTRGVGPERPPTPDGAVADMKSGTALIWFKNVGVICGSTIGGATTFCTRPAGTCNVRSHKSVQCQKMNPPQLFGSFLALRANKNAAYVAPCLDTTGKKKEFLNSLLMKDFDSEDWVAEVALLFVQ